VINAPTRALNPTIDQSIVDRALAEDPAAARAEWLAEFRSDISGWLPSELIEAAVDKGITVRPPHPAFEYAGFADPSGGARDSFTCGIAHHEGETAVLDCLVEIRPPFDPAAATAQIAAVLKQYRVHSVVGDRYGAQWVVSAFDQNGIHYKHSERDRSAIYADALPLFTSGKARLLDNRKLVSQFSSLERKTSSMGRDKIDHGPGGHDDLCNSAAGALVNVVRDASHRSETISLYELFRRSNPDNWPEPSFEENYAEAEAAAGRGELRGAQLRWFMAERAKRQGLR
jgi:hypothetical protein